MDPEARPRAFSEFFGACGVVRGHKRPGRGLALLLGLVLSAGAIPGMAAGSDDAAARCEAVVAQKVKTVAPGDATDDSTAQSAYTAHYSRQLGHCFYLETLKRQMRSPALKRTLPRDTRRLWDVDQDRDIGEYDAWQDSAPLTCRLQAAQCSSKKEWDRLARPYLKD